MFIFLIAAMAAALVLLVIAIAMYIVARTASLFRSMQISHTNQAYVEKLRAHQLAHLHSTPSSATEGNVLHFPFGGGGAA